GIVDVPAVKDHRLAHDAFHAFEVRVPKRLPFGHYQKRIGSFDAAVVIRRKLNAGSEKLLRLLHRLGVVRCDGRPILEQRPYDFDRWGIAHVVGALLKREAPDAKALIAKIPFEMLPDSV